jgi:hypothetical protein
MVAATLEEIYNVEEIYQDSRENIQNEKGNDLF